MSQQRFAIVGSRGYPSFYGGFETLVRELAPWLAARGHEVTVYCRARGRSFTDFEGPIRRRWTPGLRGSFTSTLSHGLTAAIDCRREQYSAVLVLNPANGYFLPIYGSARRVAVNVDGVEWQRAKWNRFGKAVHFGGAWSVAKFANERIFDSESIGQVWQDTFGAPGRFIAYGAQLRPTGDDVDLITELGIQPGTYALAVARLVPENSIDLILDALSAVPHIPAVVVGEGSEVFEARLRALASGRSNFRWLGRVENQSLLYQLWANSAVYVHGHTVGGTSPALVQALGCGAPTITLDTVHNREVLANPAQMFDENVERLANKIEATVDDLELRTRFKLCGLARAASPAYSWEAVCAAYEDVLLRLADQPS